MGDAPDYPRPAHFEAFKRAVYEGYAENSAAARIEHGTDDTALIAQRMMEVADAQKAARIARGGPASPRKPGAKPLPAYTVETGDATDPTLLVRVNFPADAPTIVLVTEATPAPPTVPSFDREPLEGEFREVP